MWWVVTDVHVHVQVFMIHVHVCSIKFVSFNIKFICILIVTLMMEFLINYQINLFELNILTLQLYQTKRVLVRNDVLITNSTITCIIVHSFPSNV